VPASSCELLAVVLTPLLPGQSLHQVYVHNTVARTVLLTLHIGAAVLAWQERICYVLT
jgi:hypothetical protein